MSFFVLGLMPAFILLQFFMKKSSLRILWCMGVGLILSLPFIAIQALFLGLGIKSNGLVFSAQWISAFSLDYFLPLAYLSVVLFWAIRSGLIVKDEIYLLVFLATFFLIHNIVFVLFRDITSGAYEFLVRPLYYLILTILYARLFMRFSWIMFMMIFFITLVSSTTGVFLFINQNFLAWVSVGCVILLAFIMRSVFYQKNKVF